MVKTNSECLGVKEEPYWDFYLLLHNQINLCNTVFYNLLDYSNEYIEKFSVDEDKVLNYQLLIDSSIN